MMVGELKMNHQLLASTDHALTLIESGQATREEILQAMDFIALLKEATKLLASRMEQASIEWISQNGEITNGDLRYYIGSNREYRCNNPTDALDKLLNAAGGDLSMVAGCLSAAAWKPGATRTALGEEAFKELFESRTTLDLKTGKPKLGLKKIDTKFLKDKELDDAKE